MTLTLGRVDAVLLTTAAEVMGAGSSEQLLILKATVNNQDASARTVTVYRVPTSGSPGATNIVVDALSLDAGETRALPLSGQAVTNGDSLQALASVDSVVNLNITWAVVE